MPVNYHRGSILFAILRNIFFLALPGLITSLPAFAESGDIDPFHVRNMNPFALIYGLPAATTSQLLAESESSLRFSVDIANNSRDSRSEDERICIDGETYRMALTWKRGLAPDLQIGIEVPYLSHRDGVMDGMIENWHNLLGISNSNREDWPRNRLLYRYENDKDRQLLVDSTSSGIGDIVLFLSRALRVDDSSVRLAVHSSLKLATGDPDELLGSGAADVAIWLSASDYKQHWQWPLKIYGQGGVLLKGEGDILPDQQKNLVLFGTLGVGWRPMEWIDLKAQIDGHTSHFHSDLDQLGGAAIQLTLGGSIHLDRDIRRIDVSFGENLTTDSIPDFMINLSYVHGFK